MHGPSRGGGSHFAGSSSSHSSDSSGGFSDGGFHYNVPRTIMFFGRPVYLTSGFASLVSLFVLLLIFAFSGSLISGISMSEANKEIRYMKQDAVEWEEIIEKAENGEDGYYLFTINNIDFEYTGQSVFRDGYTFDGLYASGENYELATNYCLTYDDIDYYQIFYYFYDSSTGYDVTYYTYAQFKNPSTIHHLEFAYKLDDEGETLCINTTYELDKCMEYNDLKDTAHTQKVITIVATCVGVAFLAAIVLIIVHGIKKAKENNALELEKKKAEAEKAQAEADMAKEDLKQKHRFCTYCGSPIPEGESQCPACGSRN